MYESLVKTYKKGKTDSEKFDSEVIVEFNDYEITIGKCGNGILIHPYTNKLLDYKYESRLKHADTGCAPEKLDLGIT